MPDIIFHVFHVFQTILFLCCNPKSSGAHFIGNGTFNTSITTWCVVKFEIEFKFEIQEQIQILFRMEHAFLSKFEFQIKFELIF